VGLAGNPYYLRYYLKKKILEIKMKKNSLIFLQAHKFSYISHQAKYKEIKRKKGA
jgi:hypothetical protein